MSNLIGMQAVKTFHERKTICDETLVAIGISEASAVFDSGCDCPMQLVQLNTKAQAEACSIGIAPIENMRGGRIVT